MDARSLCFCSYCEEKQPLAFSSPHRFHRFPLIYKSPPAAIVSFFRSELPEYPKSMRLSLKQTIKSE